MSKGLYFFAGAAVGGLATWFATKGHYRRLKDEEVKEVREIYDKFKKEDLKKKEETTEKRAVAMKGENIKEYIEKIGKVNYNSSAKKKEPPVHKTHYLISPEKFGEFDPDYETVSLTYYADNVLADDEDHIFEDAEEKLGDFYNHFGEYEEFSVFVRNDDLCADYEIIRDNRTYEEVVGEKPKIRWKRNE